MKIIIMDEVDDNPWKPHPHPHAVKGEECVRLESKSAHEKLSWMAKGYEIRMLTLWQAMHWKRGFGPKRFREVAP